MMQKTQHKIAKNTLYLYLRMILVVLVQLISVPIVLKKLGVEDYGIYNVVGGVVTMFSFIGTSLASGAQRFFAFSLGQNDFRGLKEVFRTTQTIYIAFAIIFVMILELLGVWFLNTKMVIPQTSMTSANWVFQFSLISFVMNLLAIPYTSLIIAHEEMSFYAIASIIDSLLKLLAAVLLTVFSSGLLVTYSALICAVSTIVFFVYRIYCNRRFIECNHFKFYFDKGLGGSLLSYSGWNMIGSLALIARNQGISIVVNLFFGPLLNAAHSLAQQVQGFLLQFINNVYVATRPQITKYYALGDEESMWDLVFKSSKWTYYLLLFVSIPFIIDIDTILSLWLGTVPEYTSVISNLLIISLLVETICNQLIGAFQAQNKIKKYQLIASNILLFNIPIAYVLLKYIGAVPSLPYIVSLILSIFYVFAIAIIAKKEIGLNLSYFFKKIVMPLVAVSTIAFVFSYFVCSQFPKSLLGVVTTFIVSFFITIPVIWFLGMNQSERSLIINYLKK